MQGNINVFDFLKLFPTEEACEKYIADARWPRGMFCPHCGNHRVYRLETQKRWKCGSCDKQFTVRTGSVLAESKVPLQKWLMAVWIMTSHPKGVSSIQMGKTLGVTQKTAWFLAHRIREAFTQGKGGLFTGVVEMDETYIGGKEKNKHESKKLKAGRGAVGKTAVVGVKQRDGKLKSVVVKNTDKPTLHGIINRTIAPGATICTDEHRAYQGLLNHKHMTVKHSVGQYVDGMASTNGIESFWALLKRGFMGVYHQMSPAHLYRYVNEYAFRHNNHELTCIDTLKQVFYNFNGKRVTYKDLKLCPIKQG